MAKAKKTILTEDTFNSNGNPAVTQDEITESNPTDTNDADDTIIQSNDDTINNDNNNEETTNETQNEETSDIEVKSESNEDGPVLFSESGDDAKEIIQPENGEPQSEDPVIPNVEDSDIGSETIGFESCHDDLYYTGKLI